MIYAIIENGIVINRIVADKDFIKEQKLNAIEIDDQDVQIGATYENKIFTNPAPIIVPREEVIE